MASGGMIGNGIKIAYSAASPVSWTSIGQILTNELPQFTSDKIDRTVSSTNNKKRSMPGMVDVSDLTFELLSDLANAAQMALVTLLDAGTTVYWRVEIPMDRAQSTFKPMEFSGFVSAWQPSAPIDDKQVLSVGVTFDDTKVSWLAVGASAIT